MPTVPVIDPNQRQPDEILKADTYRPSDPVWVWSRGDKQWRPGIVEAGSHLAVLVTFQYSGGGTAVDSLLPRRVMPRLEFDEDFDRAVRDRSRLPSRPRDVHRAAGAAARPSLPASVVQSAQKGLNVPAAFTATRTQQ